MNGVTMEVLFNNAEFAFYPAELLRVHSNNKGIYFIFFIPEIKNNETLFCNWVALQTQCCFGRVVGVRGGGGRVTG